MRRVGSGRQSIEVTIPAEVVEREAQRQGLSILDFVQNFRAEWLYDNFGGAFIHFVPQGER